MNTYSPIEPSTKELGNKLSDPATPMAEIVTRISIFAERARELGLASDRFFGALPENECIGSPVSGGALGDVQAALNDLERALTWAERLTRIA